MCDALADSGEDDQMRGAAVGHYRRANELSPSKAAAARMGGCPGSWGPVKIATFPSLADAEATLDGGGDGWQALEGAPGVFTQSGDSSTGVLVPIDAGRYARLEVGMTSQICGKVGDVKAVKLGGAWKVTYQEQIGFWGHGICGCEDGNPCDAPGGLQGVGPPCKCPDPMCPMSCALSVAQDWGDHSETYLDEKTGAGIWRVQISHEFLKDIRVDVDLSAHRFHATGLGCIADIALPK